MRAIIGLAVLGVLTLWSTVEAAKPEVVFSGNVGVRVFPKKGKISISFVNKTNPSANDLPEGKGKITFELKKVLEQDTNKNEVGKGGTGHSMMSYKSTDFAMMDLSDGVIPNSNDTDAKYLSCGGTMGDMPSHVKYIIYIAKEDGQITIGSEKFDIKKGQIKINVEVSQWKWCGCRAGTSAGATCEECRQGQTIQVGEFVELTFQLKVPGSASQKTGNGGKTGKRFSFGGDSKMILSEMVILDGTVASLDESTFKQKGSMWELMLRFPRATTGVTSWSKAIYDPTFDLGSGNAGLAPLVSLLLVALAAAVFNMSS